MSSSVAISVVSLGGWRKGRGGCVRNYGHEHDFCQAQKAENTDPRTNYAVKYATARGHLKLFGHTGDNLTPQRAWRSNKLIPARTHEKNIPPRTKFSFSLEIFTWFEIFILD